MRAQVGALCWRRGANGVSVLLITSRETRRWVIPKGNLMKGVADWDAAAIEAREEAGVLGVVAAVSLGRYRYDKRLAKGRIRPCVVDVYPLEVVIQQGAWEEGGERERRWMRILEAADAVDEPDLAALIAAFAPAGD